MAKGFCLWCRHSRHRHFVTKQILPNGQKGGPKTQGCADCGCRKYEAPSR